jgi:hypothetical protein
MTAILPDVDETTATVDDTTLEELERSVSEKTAEAPPSDGTAEPAIRVLRGEPTDEELAALVAVLLAAGSSAHAAPIDSGKPAETWGHPALLHQYSIAYSPTAFAVSPELRP